MQIRAVNGWGPRCGCGGESVLHITPNTHVRGRFLCETCLLNAIDDAPWITAQPMFWPGDEERDEPYVDPRSESGMPTKEMR